MPRATSQSRSWLITSFNVDSFRDNVDFTNIKYGIWQVEECPDTGKLHVQGYFEWRSPVRLAAAKRAIGDPQAHLEARRGSREQARDYCSKEESRRDGPWSVRLCPIFEAMALTPVLE